MALFARSGLGASGEVIYTLIVLGGLSATIITAFWGWAVRSVSATTISVALAGFIGFVLVRAYATYELEINSPGSRDVDSLLKLHVILWVMTLGAPVGAVISCCRTRGACSDRGSTQFSGELEFERIVRIAPGRARYKELSTQGDGQAICEFAARSVSGERFTVCVIRADGYRAYLAGAPYPEPIFARADITVLDPVRVALTEGKYLIVVGNRDLGSVTVWVRSRILGDEQREPV